MWEPLVTVAAGVAGYFARSAVELIKARRARSRARVARLVELLHGDGPAAVGALQRALVADPLAEPAHGALMRHQGQPDRRVLIVRGAERSPGLVLREEVERMPAPSTRIGPSRDRPILTIAGRFRDRRLLRCLRRCLRCWRARRRRMGPHAVARASATSGPQDNPQRPPRLPHCFRHRHAPVRRFLRPTERWA
jgi:hypothetical protein